MSRGPGKGWEKKNLGVPKDASTRREEKRSGLPKPLQRTPKEKKKLERGDKTEKERWGGGDIRSGGSMAA